MREVDKIEFKNIRGNANTQNFELKIENNLGSEVIKIVFPPIKRIDNLKDLKSHLLDYKEVYKKIADIDRNAAFATYRRHELNKMADLYFQAAILPENETIHNLYNVKEIAQKREAYTELVKMVDTQINEFEKSDPRDQENGVYQKRIRDDKFHIESIRVDRIKQMVSHYISAICEEVDKNGNIGFKNWEKDFDLLVKEAEKKGIKNIRGNEEKICELWSAIDSGELQKELNKEARFNKIINLLKKTEDQLEQINKKLLNRIDQEKVTEITDGIRQMKDTEFADPDKYPRIKKLSLDDLLRRARDKSQASHLTGPSTTHTTPSREISTPERDDR